MILFVIIYRDRLGGHHETQVCASTSCKAVASVLNLIPEAESAWPVGFEA